MRRSDLRARQRRFGVGLAAIFGFTIRLLLAVCKENFTFMRECLLLPLHPNRGALRAFPLSLLMKYVAFHFLHRHSALPASHAATIPAISAPIASDAVPDGPVRVG